jgi:hypothetical protein
MSALVNGAEEDAYKHIFQNTVWTIPGTLYLALIITITDGETETVTEVSTTGTGYVRQAITFTADTNGVGSNSNLIQYAVATANYGGAITGWAVMKAVSGGEAIMIGTTDASATILTDDDYSVPIGDLDIEVTPANWTNYTRSKMYNHIFKGTAYTPPTALETALYNDDPTVEDDATKVSGGTYDDQSVTMGDPTDGVGYNTNLITYPTATTDLGAISHYTIRDQLDNALLFGAFTVTKNYNTGGTFKIPVGSATEGIETAVA